MARFDADLRFVEVNAPVRLIGEELPPEALIGRTLGEAGMPEELAQDWEGAIRTTMDQRRPLGAEVSLQTRIGPRVFDARLVPEVWQDRESVLVVLHDVTDAVPVLAPTAALVASGGDVEPPIADEAPRHILLRRIDDILTLGQRCAVLVIGLASLDVERTDPDETDRLVAAALARLSLQLRPDDTLARSGEDEFLVLAPGAARSSDVERLADRIIDALAEPLELAGATIPFEPTAGLAVSRADDDATTVVERARHALATARRGGVRWSNAERPPPRDPRPDELVRLLDDVGSSTIVTDADGIVLHWDVRAAAVFGWAPGLARGRPLDEVVPGLDPRVAGPAPLARTMSLRTRDGTAVDVVTFLCVAPGPEEAATDVVIVLTGPAAPMPDPGAGTDDPRDPVLSRLAVVASERAARLAARDAFEVMSGLQRTVAELAGARTVPELVDLVLKSGVDAVDAAGAVLFAVEDDGLRLLGGTGYPTALLEEHERVPLDARIPLTEAVRQREPIWVATLAERQRRFPDADQLPVSRPSLAALPLLVLDRVVGAIGVAFDVERSWTHLERLALSTLADVCAPAFERVVSTAQGRESAVVEDPAWTATSADVLCIAEERSVGDALTLAIAAERDLRVRASVPSVEHALAAAADDPPDVVLLDGDGATIDRVADRLARLRSAWPQAPVVVLLARASIETLARVRSAGAVGVVARESPLGAVVAAVRAAMEAAHDEEHPAATAPIVVLTAREETVLDLLAQGIDPKGIADRLGISVHTCRGHVRTLLTKLGAHSQLEALAVARRMGILRS